jgi:hypothetical protein
MEHPVEEFFYRVNARCKIEHPTGRNLVQRALSVYSAAEARFSAPKYSAPIEDALSTRAHRQV